jgi:hypothetical protein
VRDRFAHRSRRPALEGAVVVPRNAMLFSDVLGARAVDADADGDSYRRTTGMTIRYAGDAAESA